MKSTAVLPLLMLLAGAAAAQAFPARPIRVVTAEVGAGGDFVPCMIAPGLADQYGQQVIVDNRGGNAVIPIDIVSKAAPDGHTLLVFGSALWLLPLLQNVDVRVRAGENASGAGAATESRYRSRAEAA